MSDQDNTAPDTPAPDTPASEDDPPGDDSFLMGVSGVDEQVLAEVARAEAQLQSGEEPEGGEDGAVV